MPAPCTDQSTGRWAGDTVLSTRLAVAVERAICAHMLPQAPVYRRNVHFFTYKGYASCPNTAQMNTPGLLRSPEETYRASVLVARLGTLLSCPIEVDWAAVLATATALKAILLRDPEAKDLCTYIDENVMYRCFTALKRPGKQGSGTYAAASPMSCYSSGLPFTP